MRSLFFAVLFSMCFACIGCAENQRFIQAKEFLSDFGQKGEVVEIREKLCGTGRASWKEDVAILKNEEGNCTIAFINGEPAEIGDVWTLNVFNDGSGFCLYRLVSTSNTRESTREDPIK